MQLDLKEVEELEVFFSNIELPEQINLDAGTRIVNLPTL
jgi:hypothetical protein